MSYPCPCQLRPGGPHLTRELLFLAGPAPGGRVLDLGAGRGESAALLQSEYGALVCAVEPEPSLRSAGQAARPGLDFCPCQAERLFCPDAWFDLALAECSLSLTELPTALAQLYRVLRPGARLALSDVYLRQGSGGEPELEPGRLLRHLYTAGEWQAALLAAGFRLGAWQDKSPLLAQMLGQLIFSHGAEEAYALLGLDRCGLREKKPGYFLLIGEKPL